MRAHHGVATPISSSRGTVATVDGEGRNAVLLWLFDHRGGYALLMIDAETIVAALETAHPAEEAYIRYVVALVDTGRLPRKLVAGTFQWARRTPFPKRVQYFKNALRTRALKMGIRLPAEVPVTANAIQAARLYYGMLTGTLLDQKHLPFLAEIFGEPGLNHKFVKGLRGRKDAAIYRKSGTWRNFHADGAVVAREGLEYIAVAVDTVPEAARGFVDGIQLIDDFMLERAGLPKPAP